MSGGACFHCALPVARPEAFQVEIDGEKKSVCCPGCKAVAELIRDTGMGNYYAMRDAPPPGAVRPADDAAEWSIYDQDEMLAAFATLDGNRAEATIYVGGMYCAACSWLIETTLGKSPGVLRAEVSPITHRLAVGFDVAGTTLGTLLATLANLGYDPQALAPESQARPEILEQRAALKRLLVASLGMMQVMMFAIGLYAGDFQGMDANMQRFLRWVSFAVTTPVVLYAARPFFRGAWRGVVSRRPGMDLPVAIAIGAAYAGSVYATLKNGPAVWYDSVVMFVFFLTLGRFLEMRARHRSIDRSTALSTLLPGTATRIDGGSEVIVPVSRLAAGDIVIVRPGEAIPADGTIVDGKTSIDEALLTGEADPKTRVGGDIVVAGSLNLDGMIRVRVEATGNDTTLGTISRLSERARYARPTFVQLADRIASHFVIAILIIAASVALTWNWIDAERAFVVTLSVLVITCPCALALATPAAYAAAGSKFARLRLLVTNGNAIDALAHASKVLFDKTGTLTYGAPVIESVEVLDPTLDERRATQIAAALESVSTHPIAHAFRGAKSPCSVSGQSVAIGEGVAGIIDGRQWRLGRRSFAAKAAASVGRASVGAASAAIEPPVAAKAAPTETLPTKAAPTEAAAATLDIYLGVDGVLVARFLLVDQVRDDSGDTVEQLIALGLAPVIVSGDRSAAVRDMAARLRIDEFHAECTPERKLEIIRKAQHAGDTVVMVGDGINDAPVLAGADVSIAPAHGAALAQTNADVILIGDSLAPIVAGVCTARKTRRIVRQNLAWAILYNLTALPLAATGNVPPWAAAIGMSASSLIVVLNSLRIGRENAA